MKLISRKEAKEQGLTHYFTGKGCKRGHVSKRYVSSTGCFDCVAEKQQSKEYIEYQSEYREENRERLRAFDIERNKNNARKRQKLESSRRCKEYHDNYRMENKEYFANWREDNRESLREYFRNHYKNNKHKYRARDAKRRAAEVNATPDWLTDDHLKQIEDIYNEREILSMEIGEDLHVDHMIPILNNKVCGLHVPWNLKIITAQENWSKNNSFVVA